jgi:hypothetical protein
MNLTDFYNYILIDVRDLPLGVAQQEIRNACVDFSEDSLAITEQLTPINVIAETHTYAIAPDVDPTNYRIVDILVGQIEGQARPMTPSSEAVLDTLYSDWRTTGRGTPGYYLSNLDRSNIRLVLTPGVSITAGLLVKVALAPKRSSSIVPDVLLERYVDAITHRTKHRCYMMKDKPWSSPDLATWHLQQYNSMVGSVDIQAAQGFARARLRVVAYYK